MSPLRLYAGQSAADPVVGAAHILTRRLAGVSAGRPGWDWSALKARRRNITGCDGVGGALIVGCHSCDTSPPSRRNRDRNLPRMP